MNLATLETLRVSSWRDHFDAMKTGAVSLALAYEKSATQHKAHRDALRTQYRAAVTTGRAECLDDNRLAFDAADPQIRLWARRVAGESGALIDRERDAMAAKACALNICRRYGVEPPPFKDTDTDGQTIARCRRVGCSKWWRRRGRVLVARRVESAAIRAAKVCRAGSVYASDPTVTRQRERRTANAELLDSLTAVNELGDTYTLGALAELSTANPTLRRHELMTRVHGLEEIAALRNDRAVFVTLTAPSEYHAVSTKTNRRNPVWNGGSPRDAQAWMRDKWALVRARLAKDGTPIYGLRCAEPHHDGTPHWHLLIFAASRLLQTVRRTIAAVFLDDLPADPQAAADRKKYGVKFAAIRSQLGSATGYIAKYLAKNIDGHQLAYAMERGPDGSLHFTPDAASAAERIRAWASTWGIRQFQFFGTPAVTVWRELRRVKEASDCPVMEPARAAADAGDYALHLATMGGPAKRRDDYPLRTLRAAVTDEAGGIRCNTYGEPMADAIKGVESFIGSQCVSRLHTWTITQGSVRPLSEQGANELEANTRHKLACALEKLAPWTRVNNCNHPPPEYQQ